MSLTNVVNLSNAELKASDWSCLSTCCHKKILWEIKIRPETESFNTPVIQDFVSTHTSTETSQCDAELKIKDGLNSLKVKCDKSDLKSLITKLTVYFAALLMKRP